MAGGRLREVVAHGGSTVLKMAATTSKGIRQARAGTCTARPELMSSDLFNLRLGPILATSRRIFSPRKNENRA